MPVDRAHSIKFRAPNHKVGGSGPVTVTFRQTSKGTSEVSLGLDYSKAATPDLSYVADHVCVNKKQSGFSIKFGKLSSDETSLRTRVEILFPNSMFQKQLIMSSRNFLEELPPVVELPEDTGRQFDDPDKTQTFKSNNVMLGAWADEGVADFYYVSPGDFAFAARNQISEIRLIPAIRVTMDLLLLREFLRQCHANDTRADIGEDDSQEVTNED